MKGLPKIFLRFFRWFCHPELRVPIEGDLLELYEERMNDFGKSKAGLHFILDVMLLLRPSIIKSTEGTYHLNHYGMLKNYFKIGIRNLLKYKAFSFINIFGLAVAMAVSLLVILLLADQTEYDQFHSKKDQIYRVLTSNGDGGPANASSPFPLANYMKENFSTVENATHLIPNVGGDVIYLTDHERKNAEVRGFFTDQQFFNIFDFELAKGVKNTALNSPNSMVISSKVAYQLFNDQNPIGKTVQFADRKLGLIKMDIGASKESTPTDFGSFTITGVIDLSKYKSHLQFDMLLSEQTLDRLYKTGKTADHSQNWAQYSKAYTYLLMGKEANHLSLEPALNETLKIQYAEIESLRDLTFIPQALTAITPGNFVGNPISLHLPIQAYYVLSILALIILLSACLNYTNLSIARVITRAKEIGVRKVNGASRTNLILQFLTESILTSMLALVMANILLFVIQPLLKNLWINELLNFNLVANFKVFFAFILLALFVGIIAGLYPSLVVSRFAPLKVLKKLTQDRPNKLGFRVVLNVIQLGCSLFFIITSILISRQFTHFSEFDYGFQSENIVNISLQGNDYQSVLNEMEKVTGITDISSCEFIPALLYRHGASIKRDLNGGDINAENISIDPNFIQNLGIKLIAGQTLNKQVTNTDEIIVNESAIQTLGFVDPSDAVGEQVYVNGSNKPSLIVGIIENFNFESPFMGAGKSPLILYHDPTIFSYLNVKISATNYAQTLARMQNTWENIDPYHPFKYEFYDDQLVKTNTWLGDLVGVISVISLLAVIISCLGLLGMAIYTTERRTKEVGIRKVLGASGKQLISMLSRSYLKLLLISIFIAAPLSYLANNLWLDQIPNRVGFGIGTILMGSLILLSIGLLTIGSQIISVSKRNPVDSLKYE